MNSSLLRTRIFKKSSARSEKNLAACSSNLLSEDSLTLDRSLEALIVRKACLNKLVWSCNILSAAADRTDSTISSAQGCPKTKTYQISVKKKKKKRKNTYRISFTFLFGLQLSEVKINADSGPRVVRCLLAASINAINFFSNMIPYLRDLAAGKWRGTVGRLCWCPSCSWAMGHGGVSKRNVFMHFLHT